MVIRLIGKTVTVSERILLVANAKGVDKFTLETDDSWAGLTPVLFFRNGTMVKEVAAGAGETEIPWEVLTPGRLYISAIGLADGIQKTTAKMAVPLLVLQSGDTRGEEPEEYTEALWQQALGLIGNLGDLTTEDKSNLVAAINEAVSFGAGTAGTNGLGACILMTTEDLAADASEADKSLFFTDDPEAPEKFMEYITANGGTALLLSPNGNLFNIMLHPKIAVADGRVAISYLTNLNGKSAYEFAVAGGYAGTEAEFAEKLAAESAHYYTSLSTAITDVNNGVTDNAVTDLSAAKVKVFTGDNGRTTVMLLDNLSESKQIDITADLDLMLNGKVLTLSNEANYIKFCAGTNCTINGEVDGSAIVKYPTSGAETPVIMRCYGDALDVIGGAYTVSGSCDMAIAILTYAPTKVEVSDAVITTKNTNPKGRCSRSIQVATGSEIVLRRCTITSIGTENTWSAGLGNVGEASGIIAQEGSTTEIIDSNISAVSEGSSVGIIMYGKCILRNSRLMADGWYSGEPAEYPASFGVYVRNTPGAYLICEGSSIFGPYSAILNYGCVHCSNCDLHGFRYGGIYSAVASDLNVFMTDTTLENGVYYGQFTDYYADGNTKGNIVKAGFVHSCASGNNGIEMYMDGCTIQGNAEKAFEVKPAGDGCNQLFMSNTDVNIETAIELNDGATTEKASIYLGTGNNVTLATIQVTEGMEQYVHETGALYRRKHPEAQLNGADMGVIIEFFNSIGVAEEGAY